MWALVVAYEDQKPGVALAEVARELERELLVANEGHPGSPGSVLSGAREGDGCDATEWDQVVDALGGGVERLGVLASPVFSMA